VNTVIKVEDLSKKLVKYDKIFFHGLGLYREVVERTKDKTGLDIEIYPKVGLTNRGKIDIIELVKQTRNLREGVLEYLNNNIKQFELTHFI